jgi:ribosomal protein L40E
MKRFGFAALLVLIFSVAVGLLAALAGGNVERATSSAFTIGATAALLYLGIRALRRDLGRKAILVRPSLESTGSPSTAAAFRDVTEPHASPEAARAATEPGASAAARNPQGSYNETQLQQQTDDLVATPTTFCTNCGAKNPDDARFCHRCGSLLFRSGKASMEDLPTPPMPRPPTSSSPAVERAASNSSGMATHANAPQRWSLAATAALLTALFGILLSGYVSYRVGMKHGFRRGLDQEKSLLTIDEPVLGLLKNGLPTVVGSQPVNVIQEVAITNYWAGLAHGEEAGWAEGVDCLEEHRCNFQSSPAVGRLNVTDRNEYWTALIVQDGVTSQERKKLMKQLRERGLLQQN